MARDATKKYRKNTNNGKGNAGASRCTSIDLFPAHQKYKHYFGFTFCLDQTRRRGSIYGRDLLGVFLRLWTCLALSELYDCLYDAFTLQWKTIILCVTGCWWSIAVGGSCTFPKCPLSYTVHIAFSHNHWLAVRQDILQKKIRQMFPDWGGCDSCTMHLSWWSVSGNPPLRKRAPGSSQSELPRIVGSTNFNSSLNIWILQSNWSASVIQSFTTISSKMINCGECMCQSSLLSNGAPGSFQSELLKIVPSSTNFRLSLNIWIIQIILCA